MTFHSFAFMLVLILPSILVEDAAMAADNNDYCTCDSVLIPNKDKVTTSMSSYLAWMQLLTWEDYQKMKKGEKTGTSVSYEDVQTKFGLGHDASQSEFEEKKKSFLQDNKYTSTTSETYERVKNSLDKSVVDVWVKCKLECKPPNQPAPDVDQILTCAWAKVNSDTYNFTLFFHDKTFNPEKKPPKWVHPSIQIGKLLDEKQFPIAEKNVPVNTQIPIGVKAAKNKGILMTFPVSWGRSEACTVPVVPPVAADIRDAIEAQDMAALRQYVAAGWDVSANLDREGNTLYHLAAERAAEKISFGFAKDVAASFKPKYPIGVNIHGDTPLSGARQKCTFNPTDKSPRPPNVASACQAEADKAFAGF